MDEIVDAVGQQVQISNDFLSLGIVFAVIVVIFFVILIWVFKYLFKNQEGENSTWNMERLGFFPVQQ